MGPLKRDVEDNYLTTPFGVRNFGNTSTLRFIFFWKCSKFNTNFKNAKTNWEKVCCFWDKCIWVGCVKLSLLRKEHMSLAVNLLTNCLKICIYLAETFSNSITFTGINKYCKSAAVEIETVFPPVYHIFIWEVSETVLFTSFRVCNFKDTSAMRLIFFEKV